MTLRCPQCRTRRATFASLLKHIEATGHAQCDCGGYHYPHRPNSPYCYQNHKAGLRHALREAPDDEDLPQLVADWAFDTPGLPSTTPEAPF